MRLNEMTYPDGQPVDGYGPGFFRVGGQVHEGAILILDQIYPWSGYDDLDRILTKAADIDVLFVGTGAEMAPIPSAMRDACDAAGIGLEPMNSPTACRTYNVLLSEGRRVALALLPV